MALFQIYRMRDAARQHFRTAAHTSGQALIKPRDYDKADLIDAPHAYGAWAHLRDSNLALSIGDVLEDSTSGEARIYKYVGFELAKWVLPEVRSGVETLPAAAGAIVDAALEASA